MVVGILATVPLDFLFIPWADRRYSNGAIGGAMAYFVTESFMFVVGLIAICPFLLNRATLWRSFRILLAGGLMLAVAWQFRGQVLVVPFVVAVVTYVASILLFGVVTDDERSMAGRLLARVGINTRWNAIGSQPLEG